MYFTESIYFTVTFRAITKSDSQYGTDLARSLAAQVQPVLIKAHIVKSWQSIQGSFAAGLQPLPYHVEDMKSHNNTTDYGNSITGIYTQLLTRSKARSQSSLLEVLLSQKANNHRLILNFTYKEKKEKNLATSRFFSFFCTFNKLSSHFPVWIW